MFTVPLFLRTSGVIIILIGLLYGVAPQAVWPALLGWVVVPPELHALRAFMGLYIGIGVLLILAARREIHWRSGLILEAAFMAGLASGRVLSLLVDGVSDWFLWSALIAEILCLGMCYHFLRLKEIRHVR